MEKGGRNEIEWTCMHAHSDRGENPEENLLAKFKMHFSGYKLNDQLLHWPYTPAFHLLPKFFRFYINLLNIADNLFQLNIKIFDYIV